MVAIPLGPIPNLQPGLRERVIKAGELIFQVHGRCLLYDKRKKYRQAGAVLVYCSFDCNAGFDAQDGAVAAKGRRKNSSQTFGFQSLASDAAL
jgi:hypothetical protein